MSIPDTTIVAGGAPVVVLPPAQSAAAVSPVVRFTITVRPTV